MMPENQVHFIGIGGIGMSGLAKILLQRQVQVSGSDLVNSQTTQELILAGAKIAIEHHPANIPHEATVVYSTAVKEDNPEYVAAKKQASKMFHRSDLLAWLMQDHKQLLVAGTHGKTTTTSLLISVLEKAGLDPSYALGGILKEWKTNAKHGSSIYFVAEADESDGSFVRYLPFGSIVTNIDLDHMDYYKTEQRLVDAFKDFLSKRVSMEHSFWCGDDPHLAALAPSGISYGFSEGCSLQLSNFCQKGWVLAVDLAFDQRIFPAVEVNLVGEHNALNAAAVFGLCWRLGIPEETIRTALKTFQGVARRCDKKGEVRHVEIIDDYAHHPVEVKAVLKGIRSAIGEKRLIAVFQPHRYSRTKDCLGTYGPVFDEADLVIITDIYSAGEAEIPGIHPQKLYQELKMHRITDVQYTPKERLLDLLAQVARPHDVLVMLGAGDITRKSQEMLERLEQSLPQRIKVGVLFGGRSPEHEISIQSARHILHAANPDLYDIQEFGITRSGHWVTGPEIAEFLTLHEQMNDWGDSDPHITPDILQKILECDIFIPMFHGPYGEDGTIQGFLETIGKAYVGPDFRAASLCTDKAYCKHVMRSNGLDTAAFFSFSKNRWDAEREEMIAQAEGELCYPLFVKPVHGGSGLGVKKVWDREDLQKMVEVAFGLDTHVMLEEALEGRELEFAIMGNEQILIPPPAEIFTDGEPYDFFAKYGRQGLKRTVHAQLSPQELLQGQRVAGQAYQMAGCTGFATVELLLDRDGSYWFVEINAVPGFTDSSLFYKIWEAAGVDSRAVIDQLIILGMHRKRWVDGVFSEALRRTRASHDEEV